MNDPGHRRWLLVALCALLAGSARAEPGGEGTDPPEPPTGEPLDPAPGSNDSDPVSAEEPWADDFGRGWAWRPTGPRPARPMAGVTVDPTRPTMTAAVGVDGTVWLSVNGGASWIAVLGPTPDRSDESNDEQVLLEVEARLNDILEDVVGSSDLEGDMVDEDEAYDQGEDLEDLQEEAIDAIRDATDQAIEDVRADLQDPWLLEHTALPEGVSLVPKIWFGPGGVLAVGRSDGLIVKRPRRTSFLELESRGDSQNDWERLLDTPTTSLLWMPERRLWVAGTVDGVRFATDLAAWIDVEDGTEGIIFYDLALAPDGVYAGTSDGLWFAPDAQQWERVSLPGESVQAVVADPEVPGRVWFSDGRTIRSSGDGGVLSEAAVDAPIPDATSLLYLGNDRLVASSSDGVWESTNGGRRFRPLAFGLTDPDCHGVGYAGRRLFLASDEGVFRIQPRAGDSDILDDDRATWIPVQHLVDAALNRAGMAPPPSRSRIRGLGSLIPEVQLELQVRRGKDLTWSQGDATQRGVDQLMVGVARLTWHPEGRKQSSNVWVVSGEEGTYVDDGRDPGTVASRTTRRVVTERMRTAARVSELYYERESLIRWRDAFAEGTLSERVEYVLRLKELEAWLDVLTDGAVSRYEDSRDEESP